MIDWYETVFGARVVHKDRQIAFLTWDHESHRLALIKVPSFLRYVFPLARWRRKVYGIDHISVTFTSLERVLTTYERLENVGITPAWSINHDPTTSLYYETRMAFDWNSRPRTSRSPTKRRITSLAVHSPP